MRDCIEVGLVHNPSSTDVWLRASARLDEYTHGVFLRDQVNSLSEAAGNVFQDSTRPERVDDQEVMVNA